MYLLFYLLCHNQINTWILTGFQVTALVDGIFVTELRMTGVIARVRITVYCQ